MATILAVVSDTHIGSTVGLCPPRTRLDDGGLYIASLAQRAVWKAWLEYWDIVKGLKQDLGAEVITVLNGDTVDRNKHTAHQSITTNEATVIAIATLALAPAARVSNRFCMIRGTAAHVGRGANLEEQLSNEYTDDFLIRDKESGTRTWWRWFPEIEGVKLDIAHHPATSSRRPWSKDAATTRLSAILRVEYLEAGLDVPDIAIRAHMHLAASSGRFSKPETFAMPSWELNCHFAHRLGSTPPVEPVGGLIFVLEDGEYDVALKTWKARTRKIWRPTE